jgi:hypothetical protein
METLLAVGFAGLSLGAIGGMLIVGRHIELEVEQAYLTGHVDGYRKAQDDEFTEGLV